MTSVHHPIRDLKINAYCGEREWIALIGDGNAFPMFRAASRTAVLDKAEAWRQSVIDKYEPALIAKAEAKAARQAKQAVAA